jgi:sugar lactone lactonase YvrE
MTHRRLRFTIAQAVVLGAIATVVLTMPAGAASTAAGGGQATATRELELFPTEIALPNGFMPEGIAIGVLPFAFFGSRADGDIYRVNLVTGDGSVISEGLGPSSPSLGMKVDLRGRLFVAGGSGGDARVINAITGEILASYAFGNTPTFVNDVVLTRDAAWFTDSQQPLLYKLPLGRFGGLPDKSHIVQLPLRGEYHQTAGFNVNGIARTPDGKALLVIQSSTGFLFRVDPETGNATRVDLGEAILTAGDGLLLSGHTLFVVQNRLNQVAVVRLNDEGTEGAVTHDVLTDPRFDVPTTVAAFGHRLYLPNARFTTPPTPETTYNAIAIPKP